MSDDDRPLGRDFPFIVPKKSVSVKFYRLQDKYDKGRFHDFGGREWELIVVFEDVTADQQEEAR